MVTVNGPNRPARVLGDRDQLKRVLLNIVDNAIKYSDNSGGSVVIQVLEEQNFLQVRVIDEGMEFLTRIYLTFSRPLIAYPRLKPLENREQAWDLLLSRKLLNNMGVRFQ
jgi:light-regulated signal transduction histidine kinase (bacteriophytochrome)